MKKTIALISLLSLASCSHSPNKTQNEETRNPSSAVAIQYTGLVGYSESKIHAGQDRVDNQNNASADVMYTMQVDCNNDRVLSREEQGRIIRIQAEVVTPQQRKKYMGFKKRAVQIAKNGNAKPFLTVNFKSVSSGNPCLGSPIGKVYAGTYPEFEKAKRK